MSCCWPLFVVGRCLSLVVICHWLLFVGGVFSGRCWFAWLSALGLLGLSDLLSLRLLLSWLCVLGFSWHGLVLGCWHGRSHPLASVHPGPATKEIGKHLDVWIAKNRI